MSPPLVAKAHFRIGVPMLPDTGCAVSDTSPPARFTRALARRLTLNGLSVLR